MICILPCTPLRFVMVLDRPINLHFYPSQFLSGNPKKVYVVSWKNSKRVFQVIIDKLFYLTFFITSNSYPHDN